MLFHVPCLEYNWLTYFLISALTGVPIAGEIIHRCEGAYWGLISFAGCSYAAGLICFISVKILQNKKAKKEVKVEVAEEKVEVSGV